ncbi:unnamed protein product [Aphanomyces euteiches]|uniref:Uncharacterized protein n=1 Tax=Aphanomyces euteiches TaxID=100861 RepID=A0A6G0XT94_9STRA|nr:hypothetical protein Ae201684_001719 [Aphanomyces euteiches]KAH9075472.1 hypothetical protein Ae201684P_004151 [Aphanomyces euteiches]KAH9156110.1 hypothetical protein AeRB84_001969 [Aphanomyces euteiches]
MAEDKSQGLVTLREQLEKVQARYRNKDQRLAQQLDSKYEYMIHHLDPFISEALEELMLHRPEQVSAFLALYIRGPIDASRFKKTQLQPQVYFDRKVHPALSLAMDSVLRDIPDDIQAYLVDFFEKRATVY